MSATADEFEPNADRADIYDAFYEVYCDIYPSLRSLFAKLATASAS